MFLIKLIIFTMVFSTSCTKNSNTKSNFPAKNDTKSNTNLNVVKSSDKNSNKAEKSPKINLKTESTKDSTTIIDVKSHKSIDNIPPKNTNPHFKETIATPLKMVHFKKKMFSVIHDLAVDSKCKYVAAGGSNMDLGFYKTKSGKQAWYRDDIRNVCKGAKCREGAYVKFVDVQKRIISALNGDTIRKLSYSGRIGPFRGGFAGKISAFKLFSSHKYAAALYKSHVAIWRTTVGLVRNIKLKGANSLRTGKSEMLIIFNNELKAVSIKGKVMGSFKTSQKALDALMFKNRWIVLFKNKVVYFGKTLKKLDIKSFPKSYELLFLVQGNQLRVIAKKNNKYFLLNKSGTKIKSRELKSFNSGNKILNFASNESCFAISAGKEIWFAKPD